MQPQNLQQVPSKTEQKGVGSEVSHPAASFQLLKAKVSGCFELNMFQQSKPFIIPIGVTANVLYTSLQERTSWFRHTKPMLIKCLTQYQSTPCATFSFPSADTTLSNRKGILPSEAQRHFYIHTSTSHMAACGLQKHTCFLKAVRHK